jgi:methionyl-tRNA formyltransferase
MNTTNRKQKFLLLAGNTNRARAYAQTLAAISDVDVHGIFYGFSKRELMETSVCQKSNEFFRSIDIQPIDYLQNLEVTFNRKHWTYSFVQTDDINSIELRKEIEAQNPDLVIFAGYGGQLISKMILDSALFLHMHSGSIPEEKGSTTLYYSILENRLCTVSAIIMVPELDSGHLLLRVSYPHPIIGMNIDRDYDNTIRADTMKQVLKYYMDNGHLPETHHAACEKENIYYVIHPVLKNIAILSLNKSI